MTERVGRLRDVLERLYRKYTRPELISPDPLQFVYRYTEAADMEIAGFLAADLAYGRVEQIERSLDRLLGSMGPSPAAFVRGFDRASRRLLGGFKHRFTTAEDICELLSLLRDVLERYGSIEGFFMAGYEPAEPNVAGALSRFCGSLASMYAASRGRTFGRGLGYLLASPERGSPCKRLNLFLRWMVRDDAVDPGLWKSVDKAKLIVPLDVHMGRLCRILGLYSQKTASLRAALRITQSFLEIEPADPIKYDFALSRIGILEDCNGRYRADCPRCELYERCLKRDKWKQ